MGKKKKKSIRQRDAPTQEQKNIALWIQSDEAKDMSRMVVEKSIPRLVVFYPAGIIGHQRKARLHGYATASCARLPLTMILAITTSVAVQSSRIGRDFARHLSASNGHVIHTNTS